MSPQTLSQPLARRGLMLILSSPSGAGKSTITRQLVQTETNITLSISATTRPQRPSEINGTHYHFMTPKIFENMRVRNELLEHAEVHGNFYGTPKAPVEASLSRGADVLFDIDWQGTAQIIKQMRKDVVSVFILPPSMAELKARLERRAEDAPQVIAKRLANARDEISHWEMYDYVLVNAQLEQCFDEVRAILAAERTKRVRATGMKDFVEKLMQEN
jgi:guanylate kinase